MIKNTLSKLWLARFFILNYKYHLKIKKNIFSINFRKYDNKKSSPKIFIPLIETNHYQYYQVLILAKALEIRGADVKILICGQNLTACEIKNSKTTRLDPCLECRFNAKNILPNFNLNFIKIDEILSNSEINKLSLISKKLSLIQDDIFYCDINITKIVNDSVLRYFFGGIPNNSKVQLIREKHILTTILNFEIAKKIYTNWNPDIIFNNMNVYSTWEPYYILATLRDMSTNVMSISTFDFNKIVLNRMDLYLNKNRFNHFIERRSNKILNKSENDELNIFLNNRFAGLSEIFKINNLFHSTLESKNAIKLNLNIDRNKKNVFLFTNLFWDVGLSDTAGLYDGVIDWVLDTIKIFIHLPDINLYIKPHPAEVFDSSPSKKGVINFIFDKYKDLPSNIKIIDPSLKLKTYDLFPFIDLGIVYNGTIGLEMLFKNIPIIVTGKSPYSFLESVNSPNTKDEYINFISKDKDDLHQINLDEIKLFAYFYFIKNLIPWNLTKSAYADNFNGFNITNESELEPGNNKYLDHICKYILDAKNNIIEDWN